VGKLEAAALALYATTVVLCTILVVGYRDVDFLGALIALTLPWSLVTLAIWSLIRGVAVAFLPISGGGAGRFPAPPLPAEAQRGAAGKRGGRPLPGAPGRTELALIAWLNAASD
jgi:hypothetical protein